jgi:hypothetical protein
MLNYGVLCDVPIYGLYHSIEINSYAALKKKTRNI